MLEKPAHEIQSRKRHAPSSSAAGLLI
jgi:hypothetical protein